MKKIISICSALKFAFTIFMAQQVNAQDYLISFAGTGASTTVSSVEVENLSTGSKVTLSEGDILHLSSDIGTFLIETNSSSSMKIYPNPMMDNSILSLYPQEAGDAVITVYEITGKTVAKISTYLENSRQEFRLSGLKNGLYLISAGGNSFQYSGKILCSGQSDGNPGIEKVCNTNESNIEKISKKEFSAKQGIVDMQYNAGERLKFKAISGIYNTVKTDIPTEDKTLIFGFTSCTDGDNNNYPVVKIGNQLWMAENLKTTKYNDGTSISKWKKNSELWGSGYCWYNNDSVTNSATYGALYNGWTLDTTSNGSKNVCPTGWHVPTDEEWTVLTDFLGGEEIAGGKLKETGLTHWFSPNAGATNETGFSALPGGHRLESGEFFGIGSFGSWRGFSAWRNLVNDDASIHPWYYYSSGRKGTTPINYGLSVRCLLVPLTTQDASDITTTSAQSGGYITSDWGNPVIARGVCWSSLHIPTISDSLTSDGTGTGSFISSITGLKPDMTYYVRAYATNSYGTEYGDEIIIKTMTGQISDIDNNTYYTVNIGNQIWMAENLKTTKYSDGTSIPLVTDNAIWASLLTPGYCWYNNDATSNKDTYGALYNWYTVNTGKLCPTGWHVPNDVEWNILTDYLGGEENAGDKLKEAGLAHWIDPQTIATNETGFSALPGGLRSDDGFFYQVGITGSWWSSVESVNTNVAWAWGMSNRDGYFDEGGGYMITGLSVRCLKNLPTLITLNVSEITTTSAKCGGEITDDWGNPVTTRGICWSTHEHPTIADGLVANTNADDDFTCLITGLIINTKYYVRAYAINSLGTSYGNEIIFSTKGKSGTLLDVDGNTYSTVEVGTQIWMAENLRTTKYYDGTDIPLVTNDTVWQSYSTPGYCWYNNDEMTNKTVYGALYSHYPIYTGKLCPSGWHVPTDAEWTVLVDYLGGKSVAGGKLKEVGLAHWADPNTGATNETGFTALPGGLRDYDGTFYNFGKEGVWFGIYSVWSISYDNSYVSSDYNSYLQSGISVRCLRGLGITTLNVSEITATSAKSGGAIAYDVENPVIARGVCWSSLHEPTISDSLTSDGTGTGSFTSSISGLKPDVEYYIRAYAITSEETIYGNLITFRTYPPLPTVTTTKISSVTTTSAISGGSIIDIGLSPVIARGVCWSTHENPTISDSKTTDGLVGESFTSTITGTANTKYYVRAYATNSQGTSYGYEIAFETKGESGTLSDVDGNTYTTIEIGNQTWMAENLKTTKYNNGTSIPLVTNDDGAWEALSTPGYCWYNNDKTTYKSTYGALYNWYTVNTGKLCPIGWHVPTKAEWTVLIDYLGAGAVAYDKIKEAGYAHWIMPSINGTNETGFTALPGGNREHWGTFSSIGSTGFWWSSSEYDTNSACFRSLHSLNHYIGGNCWEKRNGFSVRCLKDE